MDRVRGDVAVVEDNLVRAIGENRQAIGDRRAAAHWIGTEYRRGHHFVAAVSRLDDADAAALGRQEVYHRCMRARLTGARDLFVLCAIVAATPLLADEAAEPFCRFAIHEERTDRDDFALELDLARSRFAASKEIFELVDRLWESDAIQRLVWLMARHDRDVDRLDIERKRLWLERQEAIVALYELFCDPLISGRPLSADRRRSVDAEYSRYHETDCQIRAVETRIAEADLEYATEVLVSYRDLREADVATRQDIILSERDVEMAKKRIEQSKQRELECRKELAGAKGARE